MSLQASWKHDAFAKFKVLAEKGNKIILFKKKFALTFSTYVV
jgi:hypothetical protein